MIRIRIRIRKMLEKDITRKIIKDLNENGWFYKNYSGMGMGRAGIPDIIGCINGKFVAIEVKTEKGTLTLLQEKTILEIKSQGDGIAVVVYGWIGYQMMKKFILKEVSNDTSKSKSNSKEE